MPTTLRTELFTINAVLFYMVNGFVIAGLVYGLYIDFVVLDSHVILNVSNVVSFIILVAAFILALGSKISRQVNIGIVHFVVVVNLTISAIVNTLDGIPTEFGIPTVLINLAMAGSATFLVSRYMTLVFGFLTFSLHTFLVYLSTSNYFRVHYPLVAIVILGFTVVMYSYRGFVNSLTIKLANSQLDLQRSNDGLRRLKQREELINLQNRPFVVFGRNTAGLVHDFKNDISLLLSSKSLIEMKIQRGIPVLEDDLLGIARGIDRLEERIERVKYVTSAREDAQAEQIDLAGLIKRTFYPFQLTPEVNRHVQFRLDAVEPGPMIFGQRYEVLQVVENLLRNSCEAILETGKNGTIDISVRAEDGYAVAVFEDSGPGISYCFDCDEENCLDCQVFEIGKTTKSNGSGFGMVNIIQAVKGLGGRLSISSHPDRGTRIELSIPSLGS